MVMAVAMAMAMAIRRTWYLRGKVGGSGSGGRGVRTEPGLPDCALVADEGTDPVTSLAVAKHGIAI